MREPKCGLSCGWDDGLGVVKGVNRRRNKSLVLSNKLINV